MREIIITENEANQRIDRFLKKYLSKASTGFLQKMLRKKNIKLNSNKSNPNTILNVGDKIEIYFSEETIENFRTKKDITKTKNELDIVYEDKNIIIVNKPKDILTHPDDKNSESLIDMIKYYLYCQNNFYINDQSTFSPACCNRLDRNTSGLVVAAKNYSSLQKINDMIKEKKITKKYLALVEGRIDGVQDVKGFLLKDSESNKVRILENMVDGVKAIHTIYKPVITNDKYSLIEINLITGRSHQIRAHLASKGHPIIGDYKYGNRKINDYFKKKYNLKSQLLHANSIDFKDCPDGLRYLEGKKIIAKLSSLFERIVDSEIRGNYNSKF